MFLYPVYIELLTARLRLRPTQQPDAEHAYEIQTDRSVTRMLRMASFPPDQRELRAWFAEHEHQWLAVAAYRFAVEHEGPRPKPYRGWTASPVGAPQSGSLSYELGARRLQ